jgi:hypothetical protein
MHNKEWYTIYVHRIFTIQNKDLIIDKEAFFTLNSRVLYLSMPGLGDKIRPKKKR